MMTLVVAFSELLLVGVGDEIDKDEIGGGFLVLILMLVYVLNGLGCASGSPIRQPCQHGLRQSVRGGK